MGFFYYLLMSQNYTLMYKENLSQYCELLRAVLKYRHGYC